VCPAFINGSSFACEEVGGSVVCVPPSHGSSSACEEVGRSVVCVTPPYGSSSACEEVRNHGLITDQYGKHEQTVMSWPLTLGNRGISNSGNRTSA